MPFYCTVYTLVNLLIMESFKMESQGLKCDSMEFLNFMFENLGGIVTVLENICNWLSGAQMELIYETKGDYPIKVLQPIRISS